MHPARSQPAWLGPLLVAVWLVTGCAEEPQAPASPDALASLASLADPRTPNVLLVSLDTLRADHLGAYGYGLATSPNLDALAARGALFERAIAASPWTRPSHTSMLTGVYPQRHGARTRHTVASPDIPHVAERFVDGGFRTAGLVSSRLLDRQSGLARGFDHYLYIPEWDEPQGGPRRPRNPGPQITAEALRWLDASGEAPFFLFLHYYDVHSSYAAEPRYRQMFDEVGDASSVDGTTLQLMQVMQGKRKLSEPDVRKLVALYDAEIRQVDAEIGRLLDGLEARGLLASTIVAVTSDHGEEFMEHGGVLHARTYYREVIEVPLLLAGPGVPGGLRDARPVSHVDLAPTLLGLAGLPPLVGTDGVDLRVAFAGDDWPARHVFAEADRGNARPDQRRMVQDDRFKLILDRVSGEARLYDLRDDPAERRDVSAAKPAVRDAKLEALRAFEAGPTHEGHPIEISNETRDALRALGYGE